MDQLLKLTAAASYEVSLAEQALAEQAYGAAREAIDRADDRLGELRARWPQMSASERQVIGATAQTVRARRDQVALKTPPSRSLSEADVVADHEQDDDDDGDGEFDSQ